MNDTVPVELLPCPFCGDVPAMPECFVADEWQGTKWGFVACCIHGPEVRTGYDLTPDAPWHVDAIEAWNTRPQPSESREARLVGLLRECKRKLELYRAQHSGEYIGGMEYTQLIAAIDELAAQPVVGYVATQLGDTP